MFRFPIYIATCLTLSVTMQAQADFVASISVNTTPLSSGDTFYSYTIKNDSTTDVNIESFSLTVNTDSNLKSLDGPGGWQIFYMPGDAEILWSTGPDLNLVLLPGQVGNFSFTSMLHPVAQRYDIFGSDFDGQNSADSVGQIQSPGAKMVPEPVSFILLGIGLLMLVGYNWHRRHRSAC